MYSVQAYRNGETISTFNPGVYSVCSTTYSYATPVGGAYYYSLVYSLSTSIYSNGLSYCYFSEVLKSPSFQLTPSLGLFFMAEAEGRLVGSEDRFGLGATGGGWEEEGGAVVGGRGRWRSWLSSSSSSSSTGN